MWAKMIDILAIFELKGDDICDGSYNNFTFIDIYGSPINKREGISDKMNYNEVIGSSFNAMKSHRCGFSNCTSSRYS